MMSEEERLYMKVLKAILALIICPFLLFFLDPLIILFFPIVFFLCWGLALLIFIIFLILSPFYLVYLLIDNIRRKIAKRREIDELC